MMQNADACIYAYEALLQHLKLKVFNQLHWLWNVEFQLTWRWTIWYHAERGYKFTNGKRIVTRDNDNILIG